MIIREKGRDLTQSYDKSPYIHRTKESNVTTQALNQIYQATSARGDTDPPVWNRAKVEGQSKTNQLLFVKPETVILTKLRKMLTSSSWYLVLHFPLLPPPVSSLHPPGNTT